MSDARDHYQRYFAAKLWSLVPSTYRFEDGRTATFQLGGKVLDRTPYALRALIELVAEQAARARRGHDRLWDDALIELCDDWAVPYIGELVGTRLLSAADAAGRRVDVAKTIYYRRRKGTVRLIEQLAADIAGVEAVIVEAFKHLGRTHHALDERPARQLGRFTATPRGGFADLRDPRGARLAGSPFDEYARTADIRQHRGEAGRWNINRVQLHRYRLEATPISGATPFASTTTAGLFAFDPSGRPRPVFMRSHRSDDWDEWRSPLPWEVPAPMPCRLLGHAEYAIDESVIAAVGASTAGATDLRTLIGIRFRDQRQLDLALDRKATRVELLGGAVHDALLAQALVADCGKAALYPSSIAVWRDGIDLAPRQQVAAGNTDTAVAVPAGNVAVIDPERGRFRAIGVADAAAVRVQYTVAIVGGIGAGTYARSVGLQRPTAQLVGTTIGAGDYPGTGIGVVELDTSATITAVADPAAVDDLTIQAADARRPYLRLAHDWVIAATAGKRRLVLDGLWLGGAGDLVLRGDYSEVVLRRCTFDPGSFDPRDVDLDGNALAPVRVWIEGHVDALNVDRSITAAIGVRNAGLVEKVAIADSIVSGANALGFPDTTLALARCTVFGDLQADRLDATDSVFDGIVDVTDTQAGCFRFSAALDGSRVPHRFESLLLDHMTHVFTSRRFGDPGFAQIADSAPLAIRRGAESGSEMGAFSALDLPIRFDSLATKVDEYLPFGLVPIFVDQT